ncbi:MAG: bifunctional phosphoribosylaminoimidazolecarboxamide formyltransferase/IMP cyclohydrolase, partial [Candidatus Omnitrophota bacterium]|nr:bifunctional phosphoribosylaminoimidazolecarboxamide formyltransferase/IMP cyclohydrolase [Candidatus Omnitrophota bacterium]
AFYRDVVSSGRLSLADARKLHGKDLSYNNLMDIDAAMEIVGEFQEPAACIVKHAVPCGVAAAVNIKDAFVNALDCDKLSAFGGIIGLNRIPDGPTAKEIIKAGFLECIVAPGYNDKALKILTGRKNLRILQVKDLKKDTVSNAGLDIKKVAGGVLFQEKDEKDVDKKDLKVVTKKRLSAGELESLYFAWKAVKHVKSNAVVLCRGKRTVGIGSGQMSRVDSVALAVKKAGKKAKNSVLASDGFFPKPDSIKTAARAGISSIIQPGGSIADPEIINAADKAGLNMVFTGIRHFKH